MNDLTKKSKRTKIILVFFIVILVAAISGLVYLGYTLMPHGQVNGLLNTGLNGIQNDFDDPVNDTLDMARAPFKTTSIPNLASLFGLSVTEAQLILGDDYVLTKSEEATDEENPDVQGLVVFTYQPDESSQSLAVNFAAPNIYLSLDWSEAVIEVYFVSSFEALRYSSATFVSFVRTQDMLYNALRLAGVTPDSSYQYRTPDASEYTVFVDPYADVKKIKKEEFSFSGELYSEVQPTTWLVKLTYDYGVSGVTQGSNVTPNQRTIVISLR